MKPTVSLIFLFAFGASAVADETPSPAESSTFKTEVDMDHAAVTEAQDLDAEVSDVKLRANSGAKSKYSTSLYFNYSGASLRQPGGEKRPNVGGSRIADPVSASGNFGLRFRRNKNESIFVATGFYRERPFHSEENQEDWQVNTPHLGYNYTLGIHDWQISSNYRLYITTLDYRRAVGEVATLGYSLSSMDRLGTSRFSGGINADFFLSAFDKNESELRSMQTDYGLSLTPTLQFNKTDRLNIYSSLSLMNYSHSRSNSPFRFQKGTITQSLGVGAAVARDFYLSPYLLFEPRHISSANISVNLGLTVNL